MRPDRLIVGDVRGPETLELVMAMGSSNDGTVASVSGDSPQAALLRLASLSRLGASGSSMEALQALVASAVDVVVHVARYGDNSYRVASIDEVTGVTDHGFRTQQVFSFRHGGDAAGFVAAGVVPSFYPELEARGIPADTSIFRS
jgi:pilus assembly protein CpaF